MLALTYSIEPVRDESNFRIYRPVVVVHLQLAGKSHSEILVACYDRVAIILSLEPSALHVYDPALGLVYYHIALGCPVLDHPDSLL